MPSLLGNNVAAPTFTQQGSFTSHSLLDLMYEGFYALFLLKHQNAPEDHATFAANITRFLEDFDRGAKNWARLLRIFTPPCTLLRSRG